MRIQELHLFDFDGTLFKSPKPRDPANYRWWQSVSSLKPPVVPHRPSSDYWCSTPLRQAREATAHPGVYAVLATGRREDVFRRRVEHLLATQDLRFDEVHLNPGEKTPAYKARMLDLLLHRLSGVVRVVIWEDKLDYLELYVTVAEAHGVQVEAYHVYEEGEEPVRVVRECMVRVASRYLRAKKKLKKKDLDKAKKKKKKRDPKKKIKWSEGKRLFAEYQENNPRGKYKKNDRDITAYLASQGYWGFGRGRLRGKFQKALEGLKIKSKGLLRELKSAPKEVRRFVAETEYRKKVLGRAGRGLKKVSARLGRDLVDGLIGKEELVISAKYAARVLTGKEPVRVEDPDNPGKKMWNHRAVVDLIKVGAVAAQAGTLVAVGALAAATTPAWGIMAIFTQAIAARNVKEYVGGTTYNVIARSALRKARDRYRDAEEGSEEEKKAEEDLEFLEEKHRRADKISRFFEVVGKSGAEGKEEEVEEELEALRRDYGDDEDIGEYLKSAEDLASLPEGVRVKLDNETRGVRERGKLQLLEHVFKGWGSANFLQALSGSSKSKDAEAFASDWIEETTEAAQGGLLDFAVQVGRMVKDGSAPPLDKDQRKALGGFFSSILASMGEGFQEGMSDEDLKEILESDLDPPGQSSKGRAESSPRKEEKKAMYHTASVHKRAVLRVASRYLKEAGIRKKLKQKTKALLGRKPKKKKKPISQSKADRIFDEYLRNNPRGKFKKNDEDKQSYLALRGIRVKKKGVKDKFKSAMEGLKVKSKGMAEALRDAPANTRKFIMDSQYRNKSLRAAGDAIDKMTPQIAKDLVNNLVGEAKGYKEFAGNVVGVLNGKVKLRLDDPDNPGEKIWNRDAIASLYGVGAYVAAGVGTILTGGLAAAGTMGTAYAFAASKTMHSIQRTLPNTAMDYANRKALKMARKDWQAAPEGSEEEVKAKKAYDDLVEQDKGVEKRERILELRGRLRKAIQKSGIDSVAEKEFEQLREEYGDDEKFGKYLDSPEGLAAMPDNVAVKAANDNADARKRGVRELADRAFLGWEWAEVMSLVLSGPDPENGKVWGAGLLDKDWISSLSGGTNWLARRAGEVGSAIAKVVTAGDSRDGASNEVSLPEMSDYMYRRRVLAAGFSDKDRKALEGYAKAVVSSMADHYKQGLSDEDMKEILETDVEAAVSGDLVSGDRKKEMSALFTLGGGGNKTEKKASQYSSPYVAGQGYYKDFTWL